MDGKKINPQGRHFFATHFLPSNPEARPIIRDTQTNVRPESVRSEFVNCHQRLEDLRNPDIDDSAFDSKIAGPDFFRDFLGGEERVLLPVPVMGKKGHLHDQKMRLITPDVAFKLTAFNERLDAFETHARKLLQHPEMMRPKKSSHPRQRSTQKYL